MSASPTPPGGLPAPGTTGKFIPGSTARFGAHAAGTGAGKGPPASGRFGAPPPPQAPRLPGGDGPDKQRTLALAGVAGLLILVLVLSQLGGQAAAAKKAAEASTAAAVDTRSAPPVGAPRGLATADLKVRYEPITKKAPFQVRSFRPAPPPSRDPGPRREPDRPRYSPPPDPKSVEVRLTGFTGQGDARIAILEEIAGARALFVKKGDKLGAAEVAAVGTDSIVVTLNGAEATVPLGEQHKLPLEASAKLERLGPDMAAANVAAGAGGGGGAPAVQVSEDDKKSILERLRAKRAAQLNPGAAPPAGAPPAGAPPPPGTEPPPPVAPPGDASTTPAGGGR